MTDAEMARVFNLGLGMVMVVDPERVDDALAALGRPVSTPGWWAGWTRGPVGWSWSDRSSWPS